MALGHSQRRRAGRAKVSSAQVDLQSLSYLARIDDHRTKMCASSCYLDPVSCLLGINATVLLIIYHGAMFFVQTCPSEVNEPS